MLTKLILISINKILKIKAPLTKGDSIVLIADFGTSGGTRTYFFNVVNFLLKNKKNFCCYLPDTQFDPEVLEFLNKNGVSYYIKKGGFKLGLQDGFSRKINQKNIWKLTLSAIHLQRMINELGAKTLLISTAYNDEYAYFFLVNVKKLLFINHTLPYYKSTLTNSQLFNLFLSGNKRLIGVSQYSINSMINYYGIQHYQKMYCEFLYNHSGLIFNTTRSFNNKNEFILSTIGHLENYKNPFLWIEIAKQLIIDYPEYNFKFIWAGEGSLMGECLQRVEGYGNFHFIGASNKIYDLLVNTDIYIQPSLFESFGISVIDAIAAGVPVLVKNNTAMAEIIKDGKNGFVFNDKDDAIVKLKHMIENYYSLHDLTKAAKKEQLKKYSKEVWEKGIINLLRD